jgi:hypothetical protein
MRCYACLDTTTTNAMLDLTQPDFDRVTDILGLIALRGPDDCFMPDTPDAPDGTAGAVIICKRCIDNALDDAALDNFLTANNS